MPSIRPLYGGCPYLGGSVMGGSTVYTVEPLNNGDTRSEAFVLCREVVFIRYLIVS